MATEAWVPTGRPVTRAIAFVPIMSEKAALKPNDSLSSAVPAVQVKSLAPVRPDACIAAWIAVASWVSDRLPMLTLMGVAALPLICTEMPLAEGMKKLQAEASAKMRQCQQQCQQQLASLRQEAADAKALAAQKEGALTLRFAKFGGYLHVEEDGGLAAHKDECVDDPACRAVGFRDLACSGDGKAGREGPGVARPAAARRGGDPDGAGGGGRRCRRDGHSRLSMRKVNSFTLQEKDVEDLHKGPLLGGVSSADTRGSRQRARGAGGVPHDVECTFYPRLRPYPPL